MKMSFLKEMSVIFKSIPSFQNKTKILHIIDLLFFPAKWYTFIKTTYWALFYFTEHRASSFILNVSVAIL